MGRSITLEQGKTLPDADGDVLRGLRKCYLCDCLLTMSMYNNWNVVCVCNLEVVEHACSVTSLQLGETLPSVSKDMDTISYRIPLGVCAGITP